MQICAMLASVLKDGACTEFLYQGHRVYIGMLHAICALGVVKHTLVALTGHAHGCVTQACPYLCGTGTKCSTLAIRLALQVSSLCCDFPSVVGKPSAMAIKLNCPPCAVIGKCSC